MPNPSGAPCVRGVQTFPAEILLSESVAYAIGVQRAAKINKMASDYFPDPGLHPKQAIAIFGQFGLEIQAPFSLSFYLDYKFRNQSRAVSLGLLKFRR